ncbi:MAG: uroporphyrinogen decarboxylase family protein [Armatimonadota bacterium]|nr:uroporphyrinogen decarboxylase family protein [Armatimonadota bacterium]
MTDLERFLGIMEYQPVDRVPNHELGVWPQTIERWQSEGMPRDELKFDWFAGEPYFGFDRREFISLNFDMIPLFEVEVLERTERYEVVRNQLGIITRALVEGSIGTSRMCMDTYIEFPVKTLDDFRQLKKRYDPRDPSRYPQDWRQNILRWRSRDYVLVLGRNCQADGFYWRAREWMGTENLSYAWYDQPKLCHEMMETYADFTIEVARPILEEIDVEYFNLNEDFAGKGGPLIGPETFKKYIFKPMKRLVEFFKSKGTRYVILDSDGNFEPLIPLLMDAGIDMVWPLERAAGMNPVCLRAKYGRSLRLSGGVDKRVLPKGKSAIEEHLRELLPLIEEGGYIPTVDHTVPPDVSWQNFCDYMNAKRKLLEGKL